MIKISEKSIDFAFNKINDLPEAEIGELVEKLNQQQPDLFSYVLGASENLDERFIEDLLYFTIVVYAAYEKEIGIIPPVPEEIIKEKLESFYLFIEEEEFSVLDILNLNTLNTNQSLLLSEITAEFCNINNYNPETNLSDIDLTILEDCITILYVVIDSVDAVINKQ